MEEQSNFKDLVDYLELDIGDKNRHDAKEFVAKFVLDYIRSLEANQIPEKHAVITIGQLFDLTSKHTVYGD